MKTTSTARKTGCENEAIFRNGRGDNIRPSPDKYDTYFLRGVMPAIRQVRCANDDERGWF